MDIGIHKEAALRSLAIFICFLACSAYRCPSSHDDAGPKVTEPVNSAPRDVICKLASSKDKYRVGDQPEISARIINGTEKAVYLVRSIDGSERKARFPHVYYTVSGTEGGFSETQFGYCGALNSLQAEDFVKVEPGSDFDPYRHYVIQKAAKLAHSRFVKAGSYTFELHYSTEGGDIKDWRVSVPETPSGVSDLWRKVPRVNLSCSLTVDVVE